MGAPIEESWIHLYYPATAGGKKIIWTEPWQMCVCVRGGDGGGSDGARSIFIDGTWRG